MYYNDCNSGTATWKWSIRQGLKGGGGWRASIFSACRIQAWYPRRTSMRSATQNLHWASVYREFIWVSLSRNDWWNHMIELNLQSHYTPQFEGWGWKCQFSNQLLGLSGMSSLLYNIIRNKIITQDIPVFLYTLLLNRKCMKMSNNYN